MLVACWSVKGGAGTTVVASALALLLSHTRAHGSVVADLAGDVPAVLGVPDPRAPGLLDWARAGDDVPPDALARLELSVGGDLALLPRGAPGPVDADRLSVLADLLAADERPVVVDAGVLTADHPACDLVARAQRSLLVTRPCYLALRRASILPVAPDGVVLLTEEGRALRRTDVESVVGVPVVAEVPVDPSVARAVDAGLMPSRLPRSLARSLREAA